MTRFGQWWRRQRRNGYGSADVARRFDLARFRRSNWRALLWTVWLLIVASGVGIGIVGGMKYLFWAATALAALWPLQCARIALRTRSQTKPWPLAIAYAFFTMVSFWPQMLGQISYWVDRGRGRGLQLIEYKTPPVASNPKRQSSAASA